MYPCRTKQDTNRSAHTCTKKRRVRITSIDPIVIIIFTVLEQSNIQIGFIQCGCVWYSQQPRDETQPGNETVADFVQFLTDFFDFFYP